MAEQRQILGWKGQRDTYHGATRSVHAEGKAGGWHPANLSLAWSTCYQQHQDTAVPGKPPGPSKAATTVLRPRAGPDLCHPVYRSRLACSAAEAQQGAGLNGKGSSHLTCLSAGSLAMFMGVSCSFSVYLSRREFPSREPRNR